MKLRITPTVQQEIDAAIEDSLGRSEGRAKTEDSDSLYLKIHKAMLAAKKSGPVVIDAEPHEVHELKDRAEYVLECVVPDNLQWASERPYYLGLQRAYRALLKQIKAGGL